MSVSCSRDLEDISTYGASLKCNITVGGHESLGGASSSLKSQNTPPDYITGITITAHNNEYSIADVVRDIDFGTSTPSNVTMNGLTVGNNTISVVSKCKGLPENRYHKLLDKPSGNLNERAAVYALKLRERQNIYAKYEGVADVNISHSPQSADILMETKNHRLSVIVENPENSGYSLEVEILNNNISGNIEYATSYTNEELDNILNDWLIDNDYLPLEEQYAHFPGTSTSEDLVKLWGAESVEDYLISKGAIDTSLQTKVPINELQTFAFVANNEDAKENITYKIKVTYYKGSTKIGDIEKEIIANAGDNITRLYYFNGSDLEEGTAIFKNITWEDMTDDNDSVTVR